MTKIGKVEKWNLEDEVIRLDREEGYSNNKIARHISDKYSDIPELSKISAMSISRFLNRNDEDKMEERMEETKNPEKAIEREFNLKVRENIQDAENARQTINKYMEEIKDKDEIDISDIKKIFDAWTKTNEQNRKNLVSLREFTDNRIIKPTQNIIYKKEYNIKNLLLNIAQNLCDECRDKVRKEIKKKLKE